MPRTTTTSLLLLFLVGCGANQPQSDANPTNVGSPADDAKYETPVEGKSPSKWIADLSHADSNIRRNAAIRVFAIAGLVAPNLGMHGLSSTQKRKSVPPLIEMLKNDDAKNKGYAAQALGIIGLPEAKPAIAALETLKADQDEWTRDLVNEALTALKEK